MSKSLLQAFQINSIAPALTRYFPVGTLSLPADATEALQQMLFRTAGTLSNLTVLVASNDCASASTIQVRKNGANGASSVSVTAATAGVFQDLVNIETVAAGDLFGYQLVTGSAGTNFWFGTISMVYNATNKTVIRAAISAGLSSTSVASTTRYNCPTGPASWQLSETFLPNIFRTTVTLKNLFVYISTNARTTATTWGTRKNGADGSLLISVGASATGNFEDTANSDSIVATDTVGYFRRTGTGTGSIAFTQMAMDIITDDRTSMLLAGSPTGSPNNFGTTTYFGISGALSSFSESWVNAPFILKALISNLSVYISANTINAGTTTFRMRKTSAFGNLSVSVGFGATGTFTDASGTDKILPANRVAIQQVISGASGAMTNNWMSAKVKFWGDKEMIGSGAVPVPR